MNKAGVALLLLALMLGVSCVANDPCIHLLEENERLTARNFSLTWASFGGSPTRSLYYLNNANYRVLANRTIADNIKQIDANSELMKMVCRQADQ